MQAASALMEGLWVGGLAATPLAFVVALVCRIRSLRPATRHVLWGAVLLSFVTPAIGMMVWRPDWFGSEQLALAAESALPSVIQSGSNNPEVPTRAASESAIRDWSELESRPDTADITRPEPCKVAVDEPCTDGTYRASDAPADVPALQRDAGVLGMMEPLLKFTQRGAAPGGSTPNSSSSSTSASLPPLASIVKEPSPAAEEGAVVARPAMESVREAGDEQAPAAAADAVGAAERGGEPLEAWRLALPAAARDCVARLTALRDSIAAFPPIPTPVWLGGAALLVALRVGRTFAAMRVLRHARPADAEIRGLVRRVATQIGLSAPPETFVVVSAVSPMVLCWMKPRLIIPLPLWRSLEPEAKRAVLVHELAHLKRRDHVMCWIEMVIGALYWWHPVVWWARARLSDHAEASCDAWVTKLLPSSRRAYAVALVATKSYLSLRGQGTGPWLGIVSGSAGKLERRITMVMTQRTTPRVSAFGAGVATLVIGLGMFVMPSVACPPEESEAQAKKAVEKAAQKAAQKAHDSHAESFFGEAPALEAMRGGAAKSGGKAPSAHGEGGAKNKVNVVAPRAPRPPQPAQAPRAWTGPSDVAVTINPNDLITGRIAKVYKLPEGKLDAFWELMSREDVPILVQLQDGGILVHATEEQHPQIEAFIRLINPGAKGQQPGSAGGPMIARVNPFGSTNALSAEKAANDYRAALRRMETDRANVERQAVRARAEAEKAREQAEELRGLTQSLRGQVGEVSEQQAKAALERAAAEIRARSDAVRSQSRSMESRVRELEKQLEELEKRTEEIEEQLEKLEDMDPEEVSDAFAPAGVAVPADAMITFPSLPAPPVAPAMAPASTTPAPTPAAPGAATMPALAPLPALPSQPALAPTPAAPASPATPPAAGAPTVPSSTTPAPTPAGGAAPAAPAKSDNAEIQTVATTAAGR